MFKSLLQSKTKTHFLHKSNIKVRFIFATILCLITSVSHAVDSTVTKSQTSQSQSSAIESKPNSLPEWFYKELSSIQREVSVLDATGATKESVQALKERLAKVEVQLEQSQLRVDGSLKEYDNRIEDIYASTDRFGLIASAIGLVASLLAVSFGWISAGKKAKSEAEKRVNAWLEDNQKSLTTQLKEAKNKLDETVEQEIAFAKEKIDDFVDEGKKSIKSVKSEVNDLKKDVTEDVMSNLNAAGYSMTKEEKERVTIEAENISNKLDIDKTANDWRSLAIEHYFNNENIEALNFIMKAFEQENIKSSFSNYELTDILLLKGAVLGELKRLEEALDTYSGIVKRFGENKELALQEQVAKALFSKGVTLSDLKRSEEAVETYAQLVERFGESKEFALQEQVASSLANKAELVLINKDKNEAKKVIKETIEFLADDFSVSRVAIEFFNFIIKEVELESVLNFIEQIPDDEKLMWEFEIIKPVIEKLDSPHKERVKAIVRFFEEHQNKEQLKIELAKIPS